MRTILLGRPIAAEEALSCGLLCDLVDDGDLLQHAINVGAGLGERGPEALQFAKEAIRRGTSVQICLSVGSALDSDLRFLRLSHLMFSSPAPSRFAVEKRTHKT